MKIYNEVKPHEALDMRTPEVVHVKSENKYKEDIEPWVYSNEFIVRRVTNNGAVRIGKSDWLFITTAVAGKELGFKELGNRIYEIHFREFFLGYADMKDLKVYDIMTYKDELEL